MGGVHGLSGGLLVSHGIEFADGVVPATGLVFGVRALPGLARQEEALKLVSPKYFAYRSCN